MKSGCFTIPIHFELVVWSSRIKLYISISFKDPETSVASENGWLEDDPFFLGYYLFRCYLSFREGKLFVR